MSIFPTIAVLDSFKRPEESPLGVENGEKWKQFFPAGTRMGKIRKEHWETISASTIEGAYWSPEEFSEPTAAALEWTTEVTDNTYWKLWACVAHPTTSSINGYVLKLKQEGSGKFQVELEKCVANSFSELAKTTGVVFALGDRFGLSVQEGKVIAWRKKAAGSWEELVSKADATYSTGYLAFNALADNGDIINFEGGGGNTTTPSIENPGRQHSVLFKPVSLQIHATHATTYLATGLPTGLSIDETTGLITGETAEEESTVVKVKVENEDAESAETSFEWDVSEKPTNVLNMILG